MLSSSRSVSEILFRNGTVSGGHRDVAEETAIALSYGGSTHAVMMASPADLEDFAIGFSLNEGIISSPSEITAIEIIEAGGGVDIQISLVENVDAALTRRRRAKAGPVGCGLCGVESIEEALKPAHDLSQAMLLLSSVDIETAMAALGDMQPLNNQTHAVHASGFYSPGQGLVAVREDVGRHNALDKLCGHLARSGLPGSSGAVIMTSRLSVELVQKTAMLGSPVLIGISAPTALAVDMAEKAGMTLIALARGQDFEIFTGQDRIRLGDKADAA
jgi:FdhD protein